MLKITDQIASTVSKIFERIMQEQITDCTGKFLFPFLYGYRKGFSTKYALLSLIERWRLCPDKRGFAGALLMDLSLAFDTINHELLIAELHAYGFFIEVLEIFFKLSTRKTSKCQDHYNFQFFDLVTSRSSTRTGS